MAVEKELPLSCIDTFPNLGLHLLKLHFYVQYAHTADETVLETLVEIKMAGHRTRDGYRVFPDHLSA